MESFIIFDPGPEKYDRYTVVFRPKARGDYYLGHVYRMSHDAGMPNGYCMYYGPQISRAYHNEKFKRITFAELPEGTQRQIRRLAA